MAVFSLPRIAPARSMKGVERTGAPSLGAWCGYLLLGLALLLGAWPRTGTAQTSSDPAWADSTAITTIQKARRDADEDYRPDRLGDTVTVAGRALHSAGHLHDDRAQLYLQDRTAGIALTFSASDLPIQAGDSVQARGVVAQDNGLTQLDVLAHRVVDAPARMPDPVSLSVSDASSEAREGQLVRVQGLVVNRGTNAGGHYLVISDPERAGSTLSVFIANPRIAEVPLSGYEIGDQIVVTGVLGQYDYDPPYNGYYQLLPRTADDLQTVGLTQRHYRYMLIGGVLLLLLTLGGLFMLRSQVRQRTEELAQKERRIRSIFEGAAPGIAILDGNRRLQTVNPALTSILGRNADALRNTPLDTFLHSEETNAVRNAHAELLSGERSRYQAEHRFITPDGAAVWGQLSLSRLPNEEKETTPHTVVFVTDVTERKQLEEQLRHAQKMETVGTLAGGIAHDFNNILHAALAYVRMSRQDLPDDTPVRDFLARAEKGLERGEELVDQLLAFSRQETSSVEEHVDVADVVRESLDLVEPSLPDGVTLRTQLNESCIVLGDPGQLNQVATNLMTNALQVLEDASGNEPNVLDVCVERTEVDAAVAKSEPNLTPGLYVRLTVSDTGPGMAPSTRERIFEPFFTTKSVGQGTGLGLAVVHGIVESHCGAITVFTQPGEGTTFSVHLPLASDDEFEEETVEMLTNGLATNRHILLVDDDTQALEMEADRLRQWGFEVTACRSAPEALSSAASNSIDVVLTDHVMPEMSGLELAQALRHQNYTMPIVMVSGFRAKASKEDLCRAGVESFLQKPVGRRALKAALSDAVGVQANG